MKKLAMMVLVVLALTGVAASAQAMTTGNLSVTWHNTVGMNYDWRATGVGAWTAKTVTNGWATASWDANFAAPPPSVALGNVWCVDLFNFSSPSAVFAERWTDADGAGSSTAWTSDVFPEVADQVRKPLGLNEASYLAYKYGRWVNTGTAAQSIQRKQTLQAAMWTAAYGTNKFQWTSGGNVDATLLSQMVADIPNGTTFSRNEWFDNNGSGTNYQDFMNDVPEPSSLLMLGGAIFGAAAVGFRRRKRNQA